MVIRLSDELKLIISDDSYFVILVFTFIKLRHNGHFTFFSFNILAPTLLCHKMVTYTKKKSDT